MRRTLVVLADSHSHGQEGCQLCGVGHAREADHTYACCFPLVLEKASGIPDSDVVIAYDDQSIPPCVQETVPNILRLSLPREGGLGTWLDDCFRLMCCPGRSVVAVRSDVPLLPAMCLELAFDVLASGEVDVVLGSTMYSGAVQLLGMTTYHSQLFPDIVWNRCDALDNAVERLAELGLRWYILPRWFSREIPAGMTQSEDPVVS